MINVMKDKSKEKSAEYQIHYNGKVSATMTTRELEVVKLLASDLCDKQIASQLEITVSTLNTHKAHLFEKFQVHSKSGLITEAFHQNLLH